MTEETWENDCIVEHICLPGFFVFCTSEEIHPLSLFIQSFYWTVIHDEARAGRRPEQCHDKCPPFPCIHSTQPNISFVVLFIYILPIATFHVFLWGDETFFLLIFIFVIFLWKNCFYMWHATKILVENGVKAGPFLHSKPVWRHVVVVFSLVTECGAVCSLGTVSTFISILVMRNSLPRADHFLAQNLKGRTSSSAALIETVQPTRERETKYSAFVLLPDKQTSACVHKTFYANRWK